MGRDHDAIVVCVVTTAITTAQALPVFTLCSPASSANASLAILTLNQSPNL